MNETFELKQCRYQKTRSRKGEIMKGLLKRAFTAVVALSLTTIGFTLSGCGGGGGGSSTLSSQVVSGTAAVGAALTGQVNLKDSSSTPRVKSTRIGSDGSFAIDVTGMKAPYILQAVQDGTGAKFASFAATAGRANINPLSNAIVAGASGGIDPVVLYDSYTADMMQQVRSNIQTTTTELMTALQPLLQLYNAENTNPITARYTVNHTGLDGMFDQVQFNLSNGMLTIMNASSMATIYSSSTAHIGGGSCNPGAFPSVPMVPGSPAGVAAVGGANQVTVSWNPVMMASSYNIYYSTTAGVTTANGIKIANVTSPYVQSGLTAGTTYYYIVTAVNSSGEGTASAEASASTDAAPVVPAVPAAPTGVQVTGGTNQTTISWSAVSGASSYNIYWSQTNGVTTANGTKLSNATSPAVHSNLAAGTTYYYIVTAVNSTGESAASVQVAATTLNPVPTPTVPAAPTNISATGGANQVTISWTASTGATSYNVYRSTTAGVTVSNGTKLAGVASPYVNTGLTAGTTYYYIVTAVNSAGESAASTQTSATTNPAPPTVPAAPATVTATGGTNQVSLSWAAVSGATSYNVYWSTTTGVTKTNGTKLTGVTSPYTHTGLSAGTPYYYIVTAVNSAGESAASAQVTGVTAGTAIDGAALYLQYCDGCHGALGPRTAAQVQSAIDSFSAMSRFRSTGSTPLSAAQVAAIAASM